MDQTPIQCAVSPVAPHRPPTKIAMSKPGSVPVPVSGLSSWCAVTRCHQSPHRAQFNGHSHASPATSCLGTATGCLPCWCLDNSTSIRSDVAARTIIIGGFTMPHVLWPTPPRLCDLAPFHLPWAISYSNAASGRHRRGQLRVEFVNGAEARGELAHELDDGVRL
eukprot:4914560-Prymnesium_polylepis.1